MTPLHSQTTIGTQNLIDKINNGEDSFTQFKSQPIIAKELAKEMVAFLNSFARSPEARAYSQIGERRQDKVKLAEKAQCIN